MNRLLPLFFVCLLIAACTEQKEHTAAAVNERDSVPMMVSYGVNTLISDSGVIKYRILTERWEVNTAKVPARWTFHKGMFMTQFDEKFHVQAYVQADTAYYFNELKLWELRGRVKVNTADGLKFRSEEMFWDQAKHEFYSNMYSWLDTPERSLQGNYFRSDENMRHYYVSNTKGSFERSDMVGEDTLKSKPDSVKQRFVSREDPRKKMK